MFCACTWGACVSTLNIRYTVYVFCMRSDFNSKCERACCVSIAHLMWWTVPWAFDSISPQVQAVLCLCSAFPKAAQVTDTQEGTTQKHGAVNTETWINVGWELVDKCPASPHTPYSYNPYSCVGMVMRYRIHSSAEAPGGTQMRAAVISSAENHNGLPPSSISLSPFLCSVSWMPSGIKSLLPCPHLRICSQNCI